MKKSIHFLEKTLLVLCAALAFAACEKEPTDSDYIATEKVKTVTLQYQYHNNSFYTDDKGNSSGNTRYPDIKRQIVLYETFDFCVAIEYDGSVHILSYGRSNGAWSWSGCSNANASIFSVGKVNSLSEITQYFDNKLGESCGAALVENGGYVIAHQQPSETKRNFIRLHLKSYKQDAQGKITSITLEYQTYTPVIAELVAGTASGDQTITVEPWAPQAIGQLSLTGTSGGYGNLHYQWQILYGARWENISKATGTTYTPLRVPLTTKYRVAVTDDLGSVAYSNEITITVIPDEHELSVKNTFINYGNDPQQISEFFFSGGMCRLELRYSNNSLYVISYFNSQVRNNVARLYRPVSSGGSLEEITDKNTEEIGVNNNYLPLFGIGECFVIAHKFDEYLPFEFIRLRVTGFAANQDVSIEYQTF
ncbi:MAG: hypothetical protein LBU62_04870 [Bacteroidales bacterium]|jgi:hypothetical protein|nr:hypothetical protein [Bacteroidales bacterium]